MITQSEARDEITTEVNAVVGRLSLAIACLTEAYEQLPDDAADELEAVLFRPMQKAYGQARATLNGFASRFGLTVPALEPPTPGLKSQGAQEFIEKAAALASATAGQVAELQDSMLPIDAGDPELRRGLAAVREILDGVPAAARGFLSTLGR